MREKSLQFATVEQNFLFNCNFNAADFVMSYCSQENGVRMSDLMEELTEAQLLELRDAFKLYEEQSEDGKVDNQELGRLLR